MVQHFAYGSNMLAAEIRRFAPSATKVGVAKVRSHSLRFHKASSDGSAKCNAYFTDNAADEVIGALYEIDQEGVKKLVAKEGGYQECPVEVEIDGAKVHASIFVAKAHKINGTLKPYDWYKELVIAGAKECSLPQSYIEQIEAVEAATDHNVTRSAAKRSVLQRTSRVT